MNMNTYLLSWNPDKWDWIDINNSISELKNTGIYRDSWSCGMNKSIKSNDRLFLIRLGKEPRGICASGYAISNVFQGEHWSGEPNKISNYITIEYDIIINPKEERILEMDILKNGILEEQHWSTQTSGIRIKPNVANELERVWFNFTLSNTNRRIENEPNENTIYREGTVKQITSNKYERNPHARKICIEKFGLKCSVCGFDFEEIYGELGKEFIHVHHLKPIASIGTEYTLNPISDLRPVCPNCHSMIHRTENILTIDELKKKIKKYVW